MCCIYPLTSDPPDPVPFFRKVSGVCFSVFLLKENAEISIFLGSTISCPPGRSYMRDLPGFVPAMSCPTLNLETMVASKGEPVPGCFLLDPVFLPAESVTTVVIFLSFSLDSVSSSRYISFRVLRPLARGSHLQCFLSDR